MTRNIKWRATIIRGLVHVDVLLGQQHRHHLRVALLTRNVKWRATIIIGLVHVDALLGQQHQYHVHVSPRTRDEKRRHTPLPCVVHGDGRAVAIEQGRHGAGVAPLAGDP